MRFISEQHLDDGVLEREFLLDDVPGVLWTPESTPESTPKSTTDSPPAPLVLSGHNGGLHKREPRLVARARHSAAEFGFAVAAIDAPGHGERPRSPADDRLRTDLRRAFAAGEPTEEILEALVVPLVDAAVPEWRATLDALLALPGIGGRVGYGGMAAVGVRLAVLEPRVAAAGLFAGGYVPRFVRDEARRVTVPVKLLMQWDDEGNDRQAALDLFDAFASTEKTLHANVGGHAGAPWFEVEDGARFFARHLR